MTTQIIEAHHDLKTAIDVIAELENQSVDLEGLADAAFKLFEMTVEHAPEDPNTRGQLHVEIDDKNSLSFLLHYLFEKSRDLNRALHEAIERIPYDQIPTPKQACN